MKILKKVLSAVIAGSMLASMFTVAQAETVYTELYTENFDNVAAITDLNSKVLSGSASGTDASSITSDIASVVECTNTSDFTFGNKFNGKAIKVNKNKELKLDLGGLNTQVGKKYEVDFDMQANRNKSMTAGWVMGVYLNGLGGTTRIFAITDDKTLNFQSDNKNTRYGVDASIHVNLVFDTVAKKVYTRVFDNETGVTSLTNTKSYTGDVMPYMRLCSLDRSTCIYVDNISVSETTTTQTHVPVDGELLYQDFDSVDVANWANTEPKLLPSKGSTQLVPYRDTDCGKKFTGNAIQIPSNNNSLTFNLSNYGLALNKKYVMEFDLRQDVQASGQNFAVRAMSGNTQLAMLARTWDTTNWLDNMGNNGAVSKSLHFMLTFDMKEKTISIVITDNRNNYSFAAKTTEELDITAVPDIQIVSNTGVVYLDNILIKKEGEPESFEVKTFKFAKDTIDEIKAADKIVVNAMYKSTYDDAQPVKVLLAFYNGEQLVDAQIVSHDAATGTKSLKSEFTQPSAEYTSVKAMMWNGFDSMVPYCDARELSAAE